VLVHETVWLLLKGEPSRPWDVEHGPQQRVVRVDPQDVVERFVLHPSNDLALRQHLAHPQLLDNCLAMLVHEAEQGLLGHAIEKRPGIESHVLSFEDFRHVEVLFHSRKNQNVCFQTSKKQQVNIKKHGNTL
jgi:hypothetical protein